MPIYFRPYIDFLDPGSERIGDAPILVARQRDFQAIFVDELLMFFIGSRETPTTPTPAFSKSSASAVKSCASRVQPDVSSFG
jgi:hypothetical protein